MKKNLIWLLLGIHFLFLSCSSDSSEEDNSMPNSGKKEKLSGIRLYSVDGMAITYDDKNEIASIHTSRWGNVELSLTPTLNGAYLSQFSDGDRTTVSWSGDNPNQEKGYGFESTATYGEDYDDKAFCMAFNLYAMLYGDVYKPHILGILYGQTFYNKMGINAKQLVTHVDYHETDIDEYDDMSVDFEYQKDTEGNITLITYHIKTNSYKHGELISAREKTESISLVWKEYKLGDYYDGTLYYNIISNTEAQVVMARKDASSVVVPNSVEIGGKEYSVTSVGPRAFVSNSKLISIQLPNSLTTICDSAFCNCSALSSILIPAEVTSIGKGAFRGCELLSSITFPDGLSAIGDDAFYDCANLTAISLPDNIQSIGRYCFGGTSITSVVIPRQMTNVAGFENCRQLKTVKLHDAVSLIGNKAFEGCTSLSEINLPLAVTEIGSCAFEECSSLESIIIPQNVTTIGSGAFSGCSKLKEIAIPEGVTIIDIKTFSGCSSLAKVTVPSTVTEIGILAFKDCIGLNNFYCYAKQMPKCDRALLYHENIFDGCDLSNAVLHVPLSTISLYAKTDPWSRFKTIQSIESIPPLY